MPSISHSVSSLVVDVVHTDCERRTAIPLALGEASLISDILTAVSQTQSDPSLTFSISPALRIAVTPGEPCYDANNTMGLLISLRQTIVDWFKAYRRHHGLLPSNNHSHAKLVETPISPYSNNEAADSSIIVGPARLRFFRTLRVPENAKNYLLPPGLGTFPLHPTMKYAAHLPEYIKSRGGFLMPMYQREALWISFAGSGECAIKISVGGVNAITGHGRNATVASRTQDYLSLPTQPWLDGICTEPGVVRQFVAMPLGHGYTVEEQITGHAQHGGIQVDVYPSLCTQLACFRPEGSTVDITMSPSELHLHAGATISMEPRLPNPRTVSEYHRRSGRRIEILAVAPFFIIVELLMKYSTATTGTRIKVTATDTVLELKEAIYEQDGIPSSQQQLFFNGTVLEDIVSLRRYGIKEGAVVHMNSSSRRSLSPDSANDHEIGIAAGGKIVQKIYRDNRRVNAYDEECAERVWVHTISTPAWERFTGMLAPISPITFDTYRRNRLPWYSLYDEHLPAVAPTGQFSGVKSVRQLDRYITQFLDPRNPPRCPQHRDRLARCVARPCGHLACLACLDASLSCGALCVSHGCGLQVHTFIGIQEPLPSFLANVDDAPEEAAKHAVAQGDGWEGVVTLFLDEDRVTLRAPSRYTTSHR